MLLNQTLLGLGLSLVAGTALAQQTSLYAINRCSETVYLVYNNEQYNSAQKTLASGEGFEVVLNGQGHSVGFSTDPNFYSTTVTKLIMGYSINTPDQFLYYSVTSENGNPIGAFLLSSNNAQCTSVTSPNGVTYACPASSSLEYELCG